jgi:hypothetical protein
MYMFWPPFVAILTEVLYKGYITKTSKTNTSCTHIFLLFRMVIQYTTTLITHLNLAQIILYVFHILYFYIYLYFINNILSTEMDVLRRSARKSRIERIKN